MFKSTCLSCVLVLITLLAGYDSAAAAWVEDGVPLCTAPQNQYFAGMVGDGSGNVVAAWIDFRDGYWAVYAQKIDRWGSALWTENGVRLGRSICDEALPVGYRFALMCNEYGEAIVAWYGVVNEVTGACAQMVDPSGNVLWGVDGVLVGPGSMKNTCPAVASNGAGGALVAWTDTRAAGADVLIQNVDRSGSILWNPQGVPVCAAVNDQLNVLMTSDLNGGAVVAWADYRNGKWDYFAQRVSSFGDVMWGLNGIAVCTSGSSQTLAYSTIASDGKGGAILAWRDFRSVSDIYAQRIDAGGQVKWQTNGIVVCDAVGTQAGPMEVSDGAGGAYITWYDYRSTDYDVYAQRIDSLGIAKWAHDGVAVCTEPGWQGPLVIKTDNRDGVIIAWQDQRGSDKDIYAQRLNGLGNRSWGPSGVRMSAAVGDQVLPALVCLENGDAIIGWDDYRAGNWDVYAQKILSDGTLASVIREPVIVAVKDVPGDEGGFARIKLRSSAYDRVTEVDHPITFYNVWRKMAQPFLVGAEAAPGAPGAISANRLLESLAAGRTSDGMRISRALAAQLGFPAGEWESIGLHAAKQDTIYYLTVATVKDSTAAGPAWETYVVTAHTPVPSVYYVSAPDSGYSVDNLAPAVPQGLAGHQCSDPFGLVLTWSLSSERDLDHYALYRGSPADFIPEPGNRVLETAQTFGLDAGWTPGMGYFYKLSAIDRHGNESVPALLIPQDIIATLLQSFSAEIREQFVELRWSVSSIDEGCRFFVLRRDASGGAYEELSATGLTRSGLSFGYRDESSEPGLTYHYRVEYAEGADRKVLFETDAVSIPALPVTLHQNYPNPFNPSTTIGFYLPVACEVTLDVYDSAGRLVERLVDRETRSKGTHQVHWQAQTSLGKSVATGVYIYRLQTEKKTISRKMILLR